ncbi:hypothetical protein [Citreimonas salinaria]|uniref:DUF2059 domain-containing protein n=1 Tax=Citreimonas salinaria TaxID=321339 RepID=A0A1H3P2P3_9RHOB|nr:hypothetical protein [Citreimonas salinaria]SDY94689.1 hypothetical protein SAMN05444340_1412 [Citreimonas salinaria]
MRVLMTSVALCALMTPLPVAAQSTSTTSDSDVYRNDLPETHDGIELPEVGAAANGMAADLEQAYLTAAASAFALQQYGNMAAMKYADGTVRDLGDRMILLGEAVLDRLDVPGDQRDGSPLLSAYVRADLEVLKALNGEQFDQVFAAWVTTVYPSIVDAWSYLGEDARFADLAGAVKPRLEDQMAAARSVLQGASAAQVPSGDDSTGDNTEAIGAEGQTGERQHTPQTEQPNVQTGENYQHEQVETDPQTATRTLPDDVGQPETAAAAGELGIVNPAIVFALIEEPSTELAQLKRAPDFSADNTRVVSLDEYLQESELRTLDEMLSAHQSNVDTVRGAMAGHQVVEEALSRTGASLDRLVAFDVLDEGIVLYTRSAQ